MNTRPISLTDQAVRAVLNRTKTQFRRPITEPIAILDRYGPGWFANGYAVSREIAGGLFTTPLSAPYGAPGDRLWVRETWCLADPESFDPMDGRPQGPPWPTGNRQFAWYKASDSGVEHTANDNRSPWVSPIRMPRWASRLMLEITDLRVQRVQDISEDDARAEGIETFDCISPEQRVPGPGFDHCRLGDQPHRLLFADHWDRTHGKNALWDKNPWIWAYTFKTL